jgi:hypothetical protein
MYTGRPPFGADSPLAVVRRVCEARPAPLHTLRPDAPPWLETLAERLLARDPAGRFRSAAEVAEVMNGCLAHLQQPDTVPLPPAVRGVRAGSSRLGRRSAVGLLLLLGVGTAALLHGIGGPRHQAGAESDQPVREARQQPRTATPPLPEESEDRNLEMLRRRAGSLELDLHAPTPDTPDSFAETLRELRRQLDAVKADLTDKPSR